MILLFSRPTKGLLPIAFAALLLSGC